MTEEVLRHWTGEAIGTKEFHNSSLTSRVIGKGNGDKSLYFRRIDAASRPRGWQCMLEAGSSENIPCLK